MAIRDAVSGDAATLRTIWNANVSVLPASARPPTKTLAQMQAFLLTSGYRQRVWTNTSNVVQGHFVVDKTPTEECKIWFTASGVTPTVFRQIGKDLITDWYTDAKARKVALCKGVLATPMAVGVQTMVTTMITAGGWTQDNSVAGQTTVTMTPDQGLKGVQAVVV